jgi:hypothetical protein
MASYTLVCVVVSSLASEGSTTTTTKQTMFDTFPNTGPSLMHGAVVLKHQNSRQRGVLTTLAEARRRGTHPAARKNQESFVNQEDHTIFGLGHVVVMATSLLYRLSVNTGIPSRDPIRIRGRHFPGSSVPHGTPCSLACLVEQTTLSRRCITTSQPHPVIWRADLPVHARFFAL